MLTHTNKIDNLGLLINSIHITAFVWTMRWHVWPKNLLSVCNSKLFDRCCTLWCGAIDGNVDCCTCAVWIGNRRLWHFDEDCSRRWVYIYHQMMISISHANETFRLYSSAIYWHVPIHVGDILGIRLCRGSPCWWVLHASLSLLACDD